MRGYAYTDLENHKHNLILLDRDDADADLTVNGNNHVRGLLMSRLDFDSKIIEIPPIPDANIRDMLTFKIKSLYPGDPAGTQFDYKLFSVGKKRFAVLFITKKRVIEEYKSIAGKKPLLLPFILLKNRLHKCREDSACFLFWHPDWVELFILRQGLLAATTVLKRGRQLKSDLRKIAKILAKEQGDMPLIHYCGQGEERLIDESSRLYLDGHESEIHLFSDFLSHRIARSDMLFAPPSRTRLPPLKQRLGIYAFALLLLTGLLYNKCALNLGEYEKYLEQRRNESVKLYADISSMQNEISRLEEKLIMLRAKKPVNLYYLFNDLSGVFGEQTELLSFILKGNSFTLEGITPSALALEERLKKHPSFGSVSLPEFKPERNSSKERFRLQGAYNAQ
jgi:hypothetical protein